MRIPPLLALAVTLSLACAEGHGEAKVASTSTTEGDTTVVTITAPESLPALMVPLDSPRVVWTPEELGRPTGMAVGPDGRITVSDPAHIYAMQPGSDSTEVVGREGAGPGEFTAVATILGTSDGSVLVLDGHQSRIVRFGPDGKADSTWSVTQQVTQHEFLALMDSAPVLVTGRGTVHIGEPPDTIYLRSATDTAGPVLGAIPLLVWARGERMLLPRDAYPPLPRLAGSGTSGFAYTDGLQYDIRWWRPGQSPEWLHLTRAWSPPPQSIDREPPRESLEQLPDSGAIIKEVVSHGQRSDTKYSIEEMALMPQGALWVRPVDSSYVYAPAYYAQIAELRQPTRLWEVFGTDGRLRAQLRLSSMFRPKTVHDCQLYGFLENSDGVYSVATIPLGEACEKLGGS